ncbi:hypothetical protein NX059_006012 [Plenodomus lindquistii]|nr:hypothetical protein NX059_006012 [Plenodomus lindquistii]
MHEPWIAENLASELQEEQGHLLLSRLSSEDGARSSNASTIVPLSMVKYFKRKDGKLPVRSLVAMTCGIGGLQILWSTIFSHGSSYLFSLGISTTQSSLVWAAAPICGATIQPIVGIVSDRSRNPWGRRRPFILGGVLATVLASMALAWAEPIAATFCKLFLDLNSDGSGSRQASVTRTTAIISVVLLNVAIQPLQLGLRSLSVDSCPSEQQAAASAWASRFAGIGNIIGYVLGSLPLPWIASNYEAVRFRYMVLSTVITLLTTSCISCYFTEEEDPSLSAYEPGGKLLVHKICVYIRQGLTETTPKIRRVYLVQFFSWMGWFGFLFYSTSFISQLYVNEQTRNYLVAPSSSLKDYGMRTGSVANLLFSIVALATNIVLPMLSKAMSPSTKYDSEKTYRHSSQLHVIWSFGQVAYVFSVLSAVMVSSSTAGTLFIATAGLSWGITQWVPYTILGEEVARHHSNNDAFPREDDDVGCAIQGGRIMGMHNAAISVPQIMAALVSSAIFGLARKSGTENAIVWVLGWSGVPGAMAAWLAFRL